MIDKVLILICFIANLFFTNLYSQNFILINSSNKGINVIVNNKERLINGFPLIEDINTTFNEVYSSDKQIKYIINTNKALIIDYLKK